ncbi:uncharacterized protein LOC134837464 [Culicoides brevitarsis]|uniref:uncharacterized protein LOC134837464 n=1 Tax=Culicoides brevitarsis TaxID=469753 RepID=UPI00307B2A35
MKYQKLTAWTLCVLVLCSTIVHAAAYPQNSHDDASEGSRRYAEKPNNVKKVALDDVDTDIQTNQISDNPFSWTNMLGMVMQMMFNNNAVGPNKSDDLDGNNGLSNSPWANIISIGLRIITTLLGGNTNDGIDKVDNGAAGPMQNVLAAVFSAMFGAKDPDQVNTMAKQAGEFINIVVNLLDALKTSFSHRSLQARSVGRKDSMSDAAVASLAMMKSYAKTYKNSDNLCMQKYLCEANTECANDVGGNSIFCQLGTYATSFILERSSHVTFESLYEAGRQGRQGIDCKQIYLECNEV